MVWWERLVLLLWTLYVKRLARNIHVNTRGKLIQPPTIFFMVYLIMIGLEKMKRIIHRMWIKLMVERNWCFYCLSSRDYSLRLNLTLFKLPVGWLDMFFFFFRNTCFMLHFFIQTACFIWYNFLFIVSIIYVKGDW